MNRRQALEDLKDSVTKFENCLQGDTSPEENERTRLIDEHGEVEQINNCVWECEHLHVWLDVEIEKELEKENSLLPCQGDRVGARVGE